MVGLPDPHFGPDEELYRRCVEAETLGDRLFPDQIRFYRDCSVNRSRYSEAEWVLLPDYPDCGIAMFRVDDVPDRLVSEGGTEFAFRVEHAPLEENYAHTEVRTYRDGVHLTEPSPPRLPATVKKQFRTIISERAVVIRLPRI